MTTIDQITYTGGNTQAVADWVLAHNGSCTSPMAIAYNREDFIVRVGPKGMIHPLLPGDILTWDGEHIRCDSCPEAGRSRLRASIAIALLATLVMLGVVRVGAQGIADPVSYQVGDVLVFASATRNPSCSVTRNIRNTSDQPLRVIASATWPGQPVHLSPNQGSHDGDETIPPGGQATAVWTNSGYVTDGELNLTWTVLIPDGVAQIGANHLEPVPACNPTPETPETSTPTVPPVASSAPPTGPPPSTAQTVVSTPEHSPPPGVETTTTAGVLIATQPRQQLPATGDRTGPAIVAAGALLAVGALAWAAGRHLGRISDTYPPADNEDGQS